MRREAGWVVPLCGAALLVIVLLLATPAPARADHADLAAQWALDEEAAGVTPDSSGHGLQGTLSGGATLVPGGRFGNALDLPTPPGSRVQVADSETLEPGRITVLAWVRHDGSPGSYKWILAKGAAACRGPSYGFGTGANGGLYFTVWDGVSVYATPDAGATLWDGQWHAVAGTYDGANLRVYVDGAEVGGGTPAASGIAYSAELGGDLNIGNYPGSVQCGADYAFPGEIDHVGLYRRALEAAEIAELQRADHTTPPSPPVRPDTGPPPEPPPTPFARNLTAPEIRSSGDGSYTCDPGTWSNLASPTLLYTWSIARGLSVKTSSEQTYTPEAADYGWPVSCLVQGIGPNGFGVPAQSATVYFSSAGLNEMVAPYGDVRIRGIDVFQVVQANAGARMFGYRPGGTFRSSLCGGGTPSSWWRNALLFGICTLEDRDAQYAEYNGVTLDVNKGATAVVYVDVAGAAAADQQLTFDLELSATTVGGRTSLGEPVVTKIRNPPRSDTSWVRPFERDDPKYGVQVPLPSAWTSRGASIRLTARVRFPDQFNGWGVTTTTYGTRQCDGGTQCLANDTFTLNDIPFQDFPRLLIGSIQLRRTTAEQAPLPSARRVLSRARELFPGGERMVVSPYLGEIDISCPATPCVDVTALTATAQAAPSTDFDCNSLTYSPPLDDGATPPVVLTAAARMNSATRSCREDAVAALMREWIRTNPARSILTPGGSYRAEVYDVLMGVHDYNLATGLPEPGTAYRDITDVGRSQPSRAEDTPYFHATSRTRRLTAAAHELGHILTAPHASRCNGAAVRDTEPEDRAWAPDARGRLQGVKFLPSIPIFIPGTGIVGRLPARATVDGPYELADGTTADPQLYDLMSYCAENDTLTDDGTAWLSARNWNRFSRELGDLGTRVGYGDRPRPFTLPAPGAARAAGAGTGGGVAYAVGLAGPRGGQITRVAPVDREDGAAASVASSPLRLRSLGAGGRVLQDAGVVAEPGSEEGPEAGGPFSGPVARGAVAVELVRDGTVLDRIERSRPPSVELLAPRKGTRVRSGGPLQVRWRASDPDRGPLTATVDFSPDGGRTWRTVHAGPSDGRATISGSYLAGSERARVRVSISDGFSEKAVTSGAFTAAGTAPQVQILSPQAGALVRSGERTRLAGGASDDRGRPLTGRALTWFADRRRLGTGARLRVALPVGARRLRLVARDSGGREGVATVRLRVAARSLRIVDLDVPIRVRRNARTVTVSIRASAPATLRAAGRRFRVRTRRTRLTIPLPSRPAVGVVKVPFRLSPASRTVRGTIRGTLTVVRT